MINLNAVVKKTSDRLSDEEDRQLDEWIGEPWQEWKDAAKPSIKQSESWDLHYRALRDYVDTHDGNLPTRNEKYAFEGEGQLRLGAWVSRQLSRYDELPDDRRELLVQIPAFRMKAGERDKRRLDKSSA